MVSKSPFLLKCLALLLAFAQMAICAPPPAEPKPRFNCPLAPPPTGIDTTRYESLYRYCVSRVPSCDCYKDRRMSLLDSVVYKPICDIGRVTDPHDRELQGHLRFCENRCMCHGGPEQNWARWPLGPPSVVDAY